MYTAPEFDNDEATICPLSYSIKIIDPSGQELSSAEGLTLEYESQTNDDNGIYSVKVIAESPDKTATAQEII